MACILIIITTTGLLGITTQWGGHECTKLYTPFQLAMFSLQQQPMQCTIDTIVTSIDLTVPSYS